MRKLLCTLALALALSLTASAAPAGCVALTFDDGPSGDNTEALLAMLAERDVPATFFLCGYRIELYPELPRKLVEAGHELGLHGYSHTCFDALTPAELRGELARTAGMIEDATGQRPTLVRPPCGSLDGAVTAALRDAGLRVILWSVDPEDWRNDDSAAVADQICREAHSGSVILLHDMYPSSIDAAALAIDRLRAEGYEFLTVSALAERAGCDLTPGEPYTHFPDAK